MASTIELEFHPTISSAESRTTDDIRWAPQGVTANIGFEKLNSLSAILISLLIHLLKVAYTPAIIITILAGDILFLIAWYNNASMRTLWIGLSFGTE